MDSIKGYVEHIVFRNDENGYTVLNLKNEEGEVTCVGSFHFIEGRVTESYRRIYDAQIIWSAV